MQQTKETLKLSPQVRTVLAHLTKHKSLTQAEAGTVYRIRALPRRIADLKEAGYKIRSEHRQDATGQRYVRYFLEGLAAPLKEGARVRVVKPWLNAGYDKGDVGTVVEYNASGCRHGDNLWVNFDHGPTRIFVISKEVEVIG